MVADCYAVAPPTPEPTSATQLIERTKALIEVTKTAEIDVDATQQAGEAIARERVRACWLALSDLAEKAGSDLEGGERTRDELVDQHRAALDALVSVGALEAAVAEQVQVAYTEAVFHTWRVNAPVTCYIALPIEYEPRESLVAQADALSDAQRVGDLDPEAVAKVRATLERDVAFFVLAEGDEPVSQELLAAWEAGEIDVDAETLEAARFLVALLLS
jgi:hypothetical protein